MKKILLLFVSVMTLVSCKEAIDEREPVLLLSNDVRQAMIKQDGEKYYNTLSEESIALFDGYLTKARNNDISGRPTDRTNVFEAICIYTPAELKTVTVKDYIIKARSGNVIDESQASMLSNPTLINFKINGKKAKLTYMNFPEMDFVKENDVWKFNLSTFEKPMNDMIEEMAKNEGVSVNVLLKQMLMANVGQARFANINYEELVNKYFK